MNLKNKCILPLLLLIAGLNTGFFNLNLFKKPAAPEGPLKIIRTMPDGSAPVFYGSSSTRAFFTTDISQPFGAFRLTDGTLAGTYKNQDWVVTLPQDAMFMGVAYGINYFYCNFAGTIWRSDGTIPGTFAIVDPQTVYFNGGIGVVHSIVSGGNNLVYFTGLNPNTYEEIIIDSDGTYAGTVVTPMSSVSYIVMEGQVTDGLVLIDSNFGSSSLDLYRYDFITHTLSSVITSIANTDEGRGESYSNGNKFFFPTHVWGVGNYMWATDGTAVGTVQLETTTMMDSTLDHVGTAASGKEIFIGQPSAPGYTYRFYVSDGASAGDWTEVGNTGLDFRTESWSVDFKSQLGSKVVVRFYAYSKSSTAASCPIWVSDGTLGGTSLLASVAINSPTHSSENSFFDALVFNGNLFFQGYTAAAGTELWKYDGSAAPALFKDLDSANTDSLSTMVDYGLSFGGPVKLIAAPTFFLFQAYSATTGKEYYRSDGTAAGTFLLKDIYPGTNSSVLDFNGRAIGNKIVFAAADDIHGEEVWVTDGTTLGTSLFEAFNPNPGDSKLSDFTILGTNLYFSARDDVHGVEPWISDGTASGTHIVSDVVAGEGSSQPKGFTQTANGVAFYANDDVDPTSDYWSLYVTDGTSGGTSKLKATFVTDGINAVTLNNESYFVGKDGNGQELWKTNGTLAGTVMLKDIQAGPSSTFDWSVDWIKVFGNLILFAPTYATATFYSDPWVTDGTGAGTQLLKAIFPDQYGGSYPEDGVSSGTSFFFTARDADYDRETYVTDGTPAGTSLVKDINATGDASTILLNSINGKIVFLANDDINGFELWASDGTAGGTEMIKDFSLGSLSTTFLYSSAKDANFIYFLVQPDSQNWQLWKTDGSAPGTTLIYTFAATDGPNPSGHSEMISAGSYIFFDFCTVAEGCEIWRSDKTAPGTRIFWDANPGSASTNPFSLTYFQGKLFFGGTYHQSAAVWATGLTSH